MGEEHDEDGDDHEDQDEDDSSSNEHLKSIVNLLPLVVGRLQLRTWQFFRSELDLDTKVTV